MIFTYIHKHKWEWTAKFVHGNRLGRCVICGDEAYDVEDIIRHQERLAGAPVPEPVDSGSV